MTQAPDLPGYKSIYKTSDVVTFKLKNDINSWNNVATNKSKVKQIYNKLHLYCITSAKLLFQFKKR